MFSLPASKIKKQLSTFQILEISEFRRILLRHQLLLHTQTHKYTNFQKTHTILDMISILCKLEQDSAKNSIKKKRSYVQWCVEY